MHPGCENLTFGDDVKPVSQRATRAEIQIECDYRADIACIDRKENACGDSLSWSDATAEGCTDEKQAFTSCKSNSHHSNEKEMLLNLQLPTFNNAFPLDLENIARMQKNA